MNGKDLDASSGIAGDKIGECYQSSRHLLTRYRRDIVLSMYVCSSSMHWSDCAKKGKCSKVGIWETEKFKMDTIIWRLELGLSFYYSVSSFPGLNDF